MNAATPVCSTWLSCWIFSPLSGSSDRLLLLQSLLQPTPAPGYACPCATSLAVLTPDISLEKTDPATQPWLAGKKRKTIRRQPLFWCKDTGVCQLKPGMNLAHFSQKSHRVSEVSGISPERQQDLVQFCYSHQRLSQQ